MKAKFFIIPSLLLILLAACQPVELEVPDSPLKPNNGKQSADSVWTLTIQADKGVDTKALNLDGNTLTAYWTSSDKVQVYRGGNWLCELGVTCEGEKPTTATLTGTTTAQLNVEDVLTLMIPSDTWDYTGQDGTIGFISSNYAYATATVTVKTKEGTDNTITTTGASFNNEQSIYRFQFQNNNSAVTVKDFLLWSSDKKALVQKRELVNNEWTSTKGFLCVKPDSDTSEPLYVSIRNEMATPSTQEISNQTIVDTYNFVLTGSSHELYLASKGIPAHVLDAPGKFISATTIVAKQPDFTAATGTISNSEQVF